MASLRDIVASKTSNLVIPPKLDDRFPPSDGVEAPMSTMAQGYLAGLRQVVRDLDMRILVVGCLPGNLGPRWWNHPKIEVWSSQNEAKWSKAPIPKDVGAMLLLEWIAHKSSGRLLKEAKDREIVYTPVPMSTGDVRQLLEATLGDYEAPVKPRESEIWDQRGDLRRQQLLAAQEETMARAIREAQNGDGQSSTPASPLVPPPPQAPSIPDVPPPTGPSAPQPQIVPPPPSAKRKYESRGLIKLLVALRADPKKQPHYGEARRLLPEIHKTFPEAKLETVGASLSYMRLNPKIVAKHAAKLQAALPGWSVQALAQSNWAGHPERLGTGADSGVFHGTAALHEVQGCASCSRPALVPALPGGVDAGQPPRPWEVAGAPRL
jgi:hypothetical protein